VSKIDTAQLIDDAGIKGGSPTDRVIGMLLERTEAIRELHDSMREEFRGLIDTHADIKNMMARLAEKHESHEKSDLAAFAAINQSNASVGAKVDSLSLQITAATTASVIQKAQFNAGWKVIVVIGGIATAAFAIFAIFFNHNWK
jgi:hypothetical protein